MILPIVMALRQNERFAPLLWQVIGAACFLSSAVGQLGISVIDWSYYSGHTKGLEITIIDILMVAIFISQPSQKHAAKLPFRIPMLLYFCTVTVSVFFASVQMASVFYLWQLLRMYLVFAVTARACSDQRVVPALLKGLAIGLITEACYVLYQKYALGLLQPPGTFPHQNTLGLVSNLVAIPVIGLLLAHRGSRIFSLTPVAGMMIAASTASRATMGLAGIGLVITYFLSLIYETTRRKVMLGAVGLLLAAVVIPVALGSFQQRVEVQSQAQYDNSEYDERVAYVKAASMMLDDHPLGVGANNFVIVANTGGYYDRAGIAAVFQSRSGHVHNIYWLTLAETGYAGLIALLLVLVYPVYVSLRFAWKFRGHPEAELLSGLGVALLITCLHSNYEWLLITALPQYFVAINIGLIAGLCMRLNDHSRQKE